MLSFISLLVLAAVALFVEAKTFETCELVNELRRQGFPEDQLASWVCTIQHESEFRTDAIGRLNADGSWDFGLFQISDLYWCNRGDAPGKGCDVSCNELLTDDITKAAACAKKVFSAQGFSGWSGWKQGCQGALPDISRCNQQNRQIFNFY